MPRTMPRESGTHLSGAGRPNTLCQQESHESERNSMYVFRSITESNKKQAKMKTVGEEIHLLLTGLNSVTKYV